MTFLKMGVVLVIILALLCGVHYYLAHRICNCMRSFFPKLHIAVPIVMMAVLTVMMFLSIARPFQGMTQRIISFIGTCWMGLFVYLLLFFLAADLICLLVGLLKLFPAAAQKFRLAMGIGAMALALITSVYGFCHANRLYTVDYDIQLSEQTSSRMNIVMLSDLHLGAVNSEARLENIVARINQLEPDLVCIAGDFFDNDYKSILDPQRAIETLKRIRATYGVYVCFGNHDAGSGFGEMEHFLERANIRLLKDEYVVIDGRLVLAGRLDPSPIGGYNGIGRKELSAVLEGADPDLPVIVMDHNPVNVDSYPGEVDLVFSGHTHRGQIFPGSLITARLFAVDYGYYRTASGTQVIVTSGVSTWGLPMRVGTNCELVNVKLELP